MKMNTRKMNSQKMSRVSVSLTWAFLLLAYLPSALPMENDWPRTLPLEQGMVTIYQLQVDEMKDDVIHFRAALAYRESADSEPVFGAGWFESRVEIDRAGGIVHPVDLKVTETRFPVDVENVQPGFAAVLAQQAPAWNLDFTLDELETSLKAAQEEKESLQDLNTNPPAIVYRDHPALLISIDGKPVLREIESSPYQAVINTPYPLIYDDGNYYLNAAKNVWYRSNRATGPYQFEDNPPADIAAMVSDDTTQSIGELPGEQVNAGNAPEIVVATQPSELIVTEGPADFVPLVEDLLALRNSEDDVFMHVSSQQYYIVLAGRWYRADSLDGPWEFNAADALPPAFANIPQQSDQAESRVYVAGTDEAKNAVLDAQVPQTAAVKKGQVDIDVDYDGEPSFEPVDGTDLEYADNTGSTVIQSDRIYYLVEEGVWYVSDTPDGPWEVSEDRPEQVDTISPSSPVYNVKYVKIYASTPEVVYVGYTPGYTGSYVYHNTIVYGTGWHYRPWVSPRYYYPRHGTWGFHANYNSWSGWNYGLSWGWGPFNFSYYSGGYWHQNHYWHHRHYGRWGPGGYRPRPVHYGHRGNSHNRYGYQGRGQDNGRGGRGGHDNLYSNPTQRAGVENTRDNPRRGRAARDDVPRQAGANNFAGNQQPGARQSKVGRNRTGPVSVDDMRVKARVRDVNTHAASNSLLADNTGKVYRRNDRGQEQGRTKSRKPSSGKTPVNRTMPITDQSPQRLNTRIVSRSGDTTTPVSRTTQPSAKHNNKTRPVRSTTESRSTNVKSTRVSKTAVSRREPRVVNQAPRQKTRVNSSSQRTQERSRSVSRVAATPTRQSQKRSAKNTQKPIRSVSPQSAQVRQKPARVAPSKTARNTTKSVRAAPQKTAKVSRSDKNAGGRGGSERNHTRRGKR
jgi:hypothetical protein